MPPRTCIFWKCAQNIDMNRRIGAFTAFMIIFCAIVLHYFALLNRSPIRIGYADSAYKVYLTFDDGPSDRVTPKILDTLKDEGVKATFFIVGKSVKGRENIVKRAYDEGHSIGVHSYSHDYKSIYSSPRALLEDIEKCNKIIEEVTGRRSCIYRFPGGSFGVKSQLVSAVTDAGYRYVDWNASVRDAEIVNATPQELVEAAKSSSTDRKTVVLLCHDTTDKTSTAAALSEIIGFYKAGGYNFYTF